MRERAPASTQIVQPRKVRSRSLPKGFKGTNREIKMPLSTWMVREDLIEYLTFEFSLKG